MCVECSTHASIINGHGETHRDYGNDDGDGTRGNGDDAGIKSTTQKKERKRNQWGKRMAKTERFSFLFARRFFYPFSNGKFHRI